METKETYIYKAQVRLFLEVYIVFPHGSSTHLLCISLWNLWNISFHKMFEVNCELVLVSKMSLKALV